MKMACLLTLLLCLLSPLMASAAKGQHDNRAADSMGSSQNAGQLKVRSREQAIQLVKQRYQGQVLKAQKSQVGGHPGYQVKLISEGLVFYVFVDAQTGNVSRN